MKTSVIEVHDMLSVWSVDEVERRIGEVPGVKSVTVNYAAKSATVRYDETRLQVADIKSAVRRSGNKSAGESLPRHMSEPKPAHKQTEASSPKSGTASASTPETTGPKADTVAPPPSEVPALSDSAGASLEKALSIAQLLEKHRTVESCNDCHFRLDPWGIPFEEYNAVGQFQTKVPKDGTRVNRYDTREHSDLKNYQQYLDSINTVEVLAKSRVPHGPEIKGVRELKAYLLKERKEDIVENLSLIHI